MSIGEHTTRTKLIETVVSLIDEKGSRGFTTEDVLSISGISNGSLYHHFNGFDDLVTTAQIRRASRNTLGSSDSIAELVSSSADADDFFSKLEMIYVYVFALDRKFYRTSRIVGIAAALENEAKKHLLIEEQREARDMMVKLFHEAVQRGFLGSKIPSEVLLRWAQVIALGAVSNDLTLEPVSAEALAKLTVDAIRYLAGEND